MLRILLSSRVAVALALCLQLAGFLFFARGLWSAPRKQLSGFAEPSHDAAFDRLVLMVVDALRTDLALGEHSAMEFTKGLVSDGRALAFTANARSPTVTLPRLKALTTGSSPAFLDAILNLQEEGQREQTALSATDSWVAQLHRRGHRMVMLGDDTWLRLFPEEWFVKTDGVSSFFVADHTIVDRNVSRHLPELLSEVGGAAWDTAILHYLGLDHIGHAHGDSGALMRAKQMEMDGVVRQIWSHLIAKDQRDGKRSLLVVAGDHGMTPQGNHGGSSEAEQSAALIFAAPGMKHEPERNSSLRWRSQYSLDQRVEQVDLVPTLAALFGLGYPKNSMGKVIEKVLASLMPAESVRMALQANVRQLQTLAATSEDTFLPISERLALAQEDLLGASTQTNTEYMLFGLAMLGIAFAFFALRSVDELRYDDLSSGFTRIILAVTIGFFLSVASTSFIEEEHEIWFFALATVFLFLALSDSDRKWWWVVLAASVRLSRGWSHNGQKAFEDDSLAAQSSTYPAFHLQFLGLAILCNPQLYNAFRHHSQYAVLLALQAVHLPFTFAVTLKGPDAAAIVRDDAHIYGRQYLVNGLSVARGIVAIVHDQAERKVSMLLALALSLFTITRPSNTPLVAIFWLQHGLLRRLFGPAHNDKERSRLSDLAQLRSGLLAAFLIAGLQKTAFFAMGGSNSLNTVDLSQAFKGLTSYNLGAVSLLTFLSNFSVPLLWSIASRLTLEVPDSTYVHLSTLQSGGLFSLALATFLMRDHLFIFTVFSPALLYRAVWLFLVHAPFELLPALYVQA